MNSPMIENVLKMKGVRKMTSSEAASVAGGDITIEYTYKYGPNGQIYQEIDDHQWDE